MERKREDRPRDVLADNYLCVVGGQQAIEENKGEFNRTLKQ